MSRLLEEIGQGSELDELLAGIAAEMSPVIPEAFAQEEPMLNSDHFIEVHCSASALEQAMGFFSEWGARADVTVNIS